MSQLLGRCVNCRKWFNAPDRAFNHRTPLMCSPKCAKAQGRYFIFDFPLKRTRWPGLR